MMNTEIIDYQKNRDFHIRLQALNKILENIRVHCFLVKHEK